MKRFTIGLSMLLCAFTAKAETTKPLTVAVYTFNNGTIDEIQLQLALQSALRRCHFVRVFTPIGNPLSKKTYRKYDVVCLGISAPGGFGQPDVYSATFFFGDKTIIDTKMFATALLPYPGSLVAAQEMNAKYFKDPAFRAKAAALSK